MKCWRSQYYCFMTFEVRGYRYIIRLPRFKGMFSRYELEPQWYKDYMADRETDEYLCTCMSHWAWQTVPCENCH